MGKHAFPLGTSHLNPVSGTKIILMTEEPCGTSITQVHKAYLVSTRLRSVLNVYSIELAQQRFHLSHPLTNTEFLVDASEPSMCSLVQMVGLDQRTLSKMVLITV